MILAALVAASAIALPSAPAVASPFAPTVAPQVPPSSVGAAMTPEADPAVTAQFAALVAAYDEWRRTVYPEYALRRGDETRAGELTDTSLAGVHKRQAWSANFLDELRAVDPRRLGPADARDYFLLRRDFELLGSLRPRRARFLSIGHALAAQGMPRWPKPLRRSSRG
jgi:uncharacterized protein (DUF885 family)